MNLDFNIAPPSTILKKEFLAEYEEAREAIWWQLVSLSSNMFVLKKIVEFRFDLFDPDNYFWKLVINSFYIANIMSVWRISIDDGYTEGLTLNQFKNKIIQNISIEDKRTMFREKLNELKSNESVSEINDKIKQIRHNAIAHFNRRKDVTSKTQNELPPLSFDELEKVQSNMLKYFDFLCFGEKYETLLIDYFTNITIQESSDDKTDIEKILDNIAKDSFYMTGDEFTDDRPYEPEIWKRQIKKLSDKDIEYLNDYRVKFGKSKIDKNNL